MCIINLLLDIILSCLKTVGFVNDILDSTASRVKSNIELAFLILKSCVNNLNCIAFSNSLVNVCSSKGDLVFELLLVLAELGALEVGLDGLPNLSPLPGFGDRTGSDGALAAVKGQFLLLELLEHKTRLFTTSSSLKPRKNRSNLVFTNLLHETTNTGTEENFGVTKTPLFSGNFCDQHHSSTNTLVILCLSNSLGGQDIVTDLEFGIGHLVGEAHTANSNTSQHTVALVLMHN